jgi:hypothetical protein
VWRAADRVAPIVAAETDTETLVLLGPSELSACEGSVERIMGAIEAAADALALRWPS